VIRFSAALVVVAIGVLIGGVATSGLLLVYVAIGISAVALLVLGTGVALRRDELFRDDAGPASVVGGETAGQQVAADQQPASSQASSGSRVPAHAAGETFGSSVFQGNSASRGNVGDTVWGDPASRDDRPARPGSGFPDRGAAPAAPPPDWASIRPEPSRPTSATPESTAPRTPARPAAWPLTETAFPAAPAAKAATPPAPARGGTRRPSAPPTRADPVLPWADSMPTRANVGQGQSPDPVPSWLEDVDDASAPASAAEAVAPDDAHADARPATQADDEPDTWRTSSAGPDEAEPSATAADASWEPASWGAVQDAAATVTAADEAGFSDGSADAGHASADADDASTAIDDTSTALDDTRRDAGRPGIDDAAAEATEADDADAGFGDAAGEAPGDDTAGEADRAQQVTVVPGVPRYHDPNCILIRFMADDDVQRLSVPEAEEAGCTPCRACQPE